jgi:hypothetical protein
MNGYRVQQNDRVGKRRNCSGFARMLFSDGKRTGGMSDGTDGEGKCMNVDMTKAGPELNIA